MKSEAEVVHEAAMELARQAFSDRDKPSARELFQGAMEKERWAAENWAETSGLEPTRSILYRSAASLAWNCEDYPEVVRLARKGLAYPLPATSPRSSRSSSRWSIEKGRCSLIPRFSTAQEGVDLRVGHDKAPWISHR